MTQLLPRAISSASPRAHIEHESRVEGPRERRQRAITPEAALRRQTRIKSAVFCAAVAAAPSECYCLTFIFARLSRTYVLNKISSRCARLIRKDTRATLLFIGGAHYAPAHLEISRSLALSAQVQRAQPTPSDRPVARAHRETILTVYLYVLSIREGAQFTLPLAII